MYDYVGWHFRSGLMLCSWWVASWDIQLCGWQVESGMNLCGSQVGFLRYAPIWAWPGIRYEAMWLVFAHTVHEWWVKFMRHLIMCASTRVQSGVSYLTPGQWNSWVQLENWVWATLLSGSILDTFRYVGLAKVESCMKHVAVKWGSWGMLIWRADQESDLKLCD